MLLPLVMLGTPTRKPSRMPQQQQQQEHGKHGNGNSSQSQQSYSCKVSDRFTTYVRDDGLWERHTIDLIGHNGGNAGYSVTVVATKVDGTITYNNECKV